MSDKAKITVKENLFDAMQLQTPAVLSGSSFDFPCSLFLNNRYILKDGILLNVKYELKKSVERCHK